jgi:hypothetical protein
VLTDRFFPDEPDDVRDVDDAQHWVRVYTVALQDLTRVAAASPTPDSLSRVLIVRSRLTWWQRREAKLANDAYQRETGLESG